MLGIECWVLFEYCRVFLEEFFESRACSFGNCLGGGYSCVLGIYFLIESIFKF